MFCQKIHSQVTFIGHWTLEELIFTVETFEHMHHWGEHLFIWLKQCIPNPTTFLLLQIFQACSERSFLVYDIIIRAYRNLHLSLLDNEFSIKFHPLKLYKKQQFPFSVPFCWVLHFIFIKIWFYILLWISKY